MKNSINRLWLCLILFLTLSAGAWAQQMSPSDYVIGDWAAPDGASVTFQYHSAASLKMVFPTGQAFVVGTSPTAGKS